MEALCYQLISNKSTGKTDESAFVPQLEKISCLHVLLQHYGYTKDISRQAPPGSPELSTGKHIGIQNAALYVSLRSTYDSVLQIFHPLKWEWPITAAARSKA
jgi:hypothetical protein